MRTANPALHGNVFTSERQQVGSSIQQMTISGAVNRSILLLIIVMVTAWWSWQQSLVSSGYGEYAGYAPTPWLMLGAIGGLIVAMVTIFKKSWAPWTAPLYAGLEGLFLGSISAMFESQFPGIVTQAVLGTFGTFAILLLAYKSGVIKATENFRLGLIAATGGVFFIYMISFVMSFFGMTIPYIHESGLIGIGFSVFVVVIAALNLVLDFDLIESGERMGAPKYMEWYAAFALLVTLIWLYLEILRLLAKSRRR